MNNIPSYDDFILESLVLEASQKDVQRVQDIVTKSKGDNILYPRHWLPPA
jgi:hypothetical protein